MYKQVIQPFLFKKSPEDAHDYVTNKLKIVVKLPLIKPVLRGLYNYEHPKLVREVFGLKFKNPVGLAAGFDKDAKLFNELATLGFGFIEIGTVTPQPQEGNPKPRLFRLAADAALINRMGFNSEGVEQAAERLKHNTIDLILGGNIGKNKVTPNEKAVDDYIDAFKALFDYVHYFVVNVSSPNTPGLRELQDKEPLAHLLRELQACNHSKSNPKPILLKISPDLTSEGLDNIIDIVLETNIAGVIATNTTISRAGLTTDPKEIEAIGSGGLSGKPVKDRSTEVIRYLSQTANGAFPIIGVGGIHSPADAIEKLNAGASLVQIYTGFIYEGPQLISAINKEIVRQGI